jgi:hypothetical protein
VANYPDICEFKDVPARTFEGAVLASHLVIVQDQPWIAFIESDMIGSCGTQSSGCFETLPCYCEYIPLENAGRARLVLAPVDDLSKRRVIELDLADKAAARVRASTAKNGALIVAVSGVSTSTRGASVVEYLRIAFDR